MTATPGGVDPSAGPEASADTIVAYAGEGGATGHAVRGGLRGDLRLRLVVIFAGALLLRLILAVVILPDSGHRSDLAILAQWANELAKHGPGAFYRPGSGYFADYPPAYLYVLWLTGVIGSWLGAGAADPSFPPIALKLPYIAADLAAGWFLFLWVRRVVGPSAGVTAAALFLFNPAIIVISTIWGQNDPVATAAVLAAAWLLATDRLEWAAVAACTALLVKFQYGFMVPIAAIVILRRELVGSPDRPPDRWRLIRTGIAGFLAIDLICLPFGLLPVAPWDPAHSLLARFVAANAAFPGVTQNAFNLWMNPIADIIRTGASGITEGHVVDDTVALFRIGGLALSAQWVGNLLFVGAVVLALGVMRRRDDALAVAFVGLAVAVAFFDLPTRIHERYLYPAVALAIPFFWSGRPWRLVLAGVSAVLFLDAYWVYSLPIGNAGPGRGPLGVTVYSTPGIYLLALLTDVILVWLLWQARHPAAIPAGLDAAVTGAHTGLAGATVPGAAEPAPDVPAAPIGALPERMGSRPPAARLLARLRARRTEVERRLERGLARLERLLARPRPGTIATGLLFGAVALAGALVAARTGWFTGPWLWNPDLPKIDGPLARFYHDALAAGRLPLWNDQMGLGFPLYAEGQIGAFYPPNWLIFQLPPLAALDVTRVLHLVLAGVGAGFLALRVSRSRLGAVIAVVVAVLGGAIVTKLEWTNVVVAYGWMPWVLLPFAGRRLPSRRATVAAGTLWGIQALAGHPNTWLLTGIAAVVLLVASNPRPRVIGRVVAFGLLGGAVGAVQLVPTLLLTTLSVRSSSLSAADLFASAATPFDILGLGFANAFARSTASGSWDLFKLWYPDSTFALLEAGIYVGLPVVALAAAALGARRARPMLVLAALSLVMPVVAAFQPSWWSSIPLLNVLRSPVRAYMITSLAIAVLAAVGAGRVVGSRHARRPDPFAAGAIAVGVVVGAYLAVQWLAGSAPDAFNAVYAFSSSFLDRANLPAIRQLAIDALADPLPRIPELGLGVLTLALVAVAGRGLAGRRTMRLVLAAVAVTPLFLFGAAPNSTAVIASIDSTGTSFVQAARGVGAHRLLTLGEPGWYAGMPDQLAAAGVPDIRMFSSLDLGATESIVTSLRQAGADAEIRRALGVDVVVTFNGTCPGTTLAFDKETGATFCRDAAALDPPYWIPADRATALPGSRATPVSPLELAIATSGLGAVAVAPTSAITAPGALDAHVDAPADGWVWIDRGWWPGWRVSVDGVAVTAGRAMGGMIVPVTAGSHRITADLVPWDALLGLVAGVLALTLAATWVRLERRVRRR